MADVSWPSDLCMILRDGYTETVENNVRRTELEDGAIAQSKVASRDFLIRRFTVLVKDSDATEFRAWTSTNANVWFNFRDLDGQTRECRLRGGNATVQLVREAAARLNGERFSRAGVEIEGY